MTLGVALAIAVLIVYREGKSLFGQTEFGYDVILGANRGSPMQLVMNTVYDIDQSPGNIPYSTYDMLSDNRTYLKNVKIAIPIAVGDSYKNHRIVSTVPKMFGFADDGRTRLSDDETFEYQRGRHYEIADGSCFRADRFEAVIGCDVTKETGLTIGTVFQATHGTPLPTETPDIHPEKWTVVGRLARTGTAADHVVYIPLTTFYCIAEHEEGLSAQAMIRAGIDPTKLSPELKPKEEEPSTEPAAQSPATKAATLAAQTNEEGHHYDLRPDGSIQLNLPKSDWALSAILVKARGGESSAFRANELMYLFRVRNEALAVSPAQVMRQFFDTFLKGSTLVLLLISALVTIVAAVGILVSIYNSVSARKREIAILRALGATRGRVVTIICFEAALIGLIGGVLGLLIGHAMAAVGSQYLSAFLGQGIKWLTIDSREVLYLIGVTLLATIAGLVPAAAAYRTPVATNLVPA